MQRESTKSALEKSFQTQSTFKRNTRYYDAPKVINTENKYSIKRRSPILSSNDLSRKLDSSFSINTIASKINTDIDRFRNRVSVETDKSDYQLQYLPPNSPKYSSVDCRLRSFSMQKLSPRNYHSNLRNKQIQDERLFNNFKIEPLDLTRTPDFSKSQGKSLNYVLHHLNDISYDSQKPFEYFYYKTTTMQPQVNFKLQRSTRQLFKRRRKEDEPTTDLNPEKVNDGLESTSITCRKISPFYLQTGRQMLSHCEMRKTTNLTNFKKGPDGRLIKPTLDYAYMKRKSQLVSLRLDKMKKSKRPSFLRNQICDQKYFKTKAIK